MTFGVNKRMYQDMTITTERQTIAYQIPVSRTIIPSLDVVGVKIVRATALLAPELIPCQHRFTPSPVSSTLPLAVFSREIPSNLRGFRMPLIPHPTLGLPLNLFPAIYFILYLLSTIKSLRLPSGLRVIQFSHSTLSSVDFNRPLCFHN